MTEMMFSEIRNAHPLALDSVPLLALPEFLEEVRASVGAGARVCALFGVPEARLPGGDAAGGLRLIAVVAQDDQGLLRIGATRVGESYPALTPDCPQVHWFEREIAEQWGVLPCGHPWLKPIRFQPDPRGSSAPRPKIGVTDFFRMEGAEGHEVAVGPVHAGVIEPGHFRFLCHGEEVYHLEISLGYQHRGVERALLGGPDRRSLHLIETLAGDTTVGHATAYACALEALSGAVVPPRALAIRGIALELERLANHTGDLGALSGDVGYLPTQSFCGRIRGDFLNMTALLCGSRFGRSLVVPGGVGFELEPERAADLGNRLGNAVRDVTDAVGLLWRTQSVLDRFEGTGEVTAQMARDLGLVGPPARACGVKRDVRQDFPRGIYRFAHVPLSAWNTGDVFARAFVRWLEIERSAGFIRDCLQTLPAGPLVAGPGALAPRSLVVALVEGFRGEICHVAITGDGGRFAHYKVIDPSFHNWFGLAMALRDQQISDFPLCNKSFNLSYCGHDL